MEICDAFLLWEIKGMFRVAFAAVRLVPDAVNHFMMVVTAGRGLGHTKRMPL